MRQPHAATRGKGMLSHALPPPATRCHQHPSWCHFTRSRRASARPGCPPCLLGDGTPPACAPQAPALLREGASGRAWGQPTTSRGRERRRGGGGSPPSCRGEAGGAQSRPGHRHQLRPGRAAARGASGPHRPHGGGATGTSSRPDFSRESSVTGTAVSFRTLPLPLLESSARRTHDK